MNNAASEDIGIIEETETLDSSDTEKVYIEQTNTLSGQTSIGQQYFQMYFTDKKKLKASKHISKKRSYSEYSKEEPTSSQMECSPATFMHSHVAPSVSKEPTKKKLRFSSYELDDTDYWAEFLSFDLDEDCDTEKSNSDSDFKSLVELL